MVFENGKIVEFDRPEGFAAENRRFSFRIVFLISSRKRKIII